MGYPARLAAAALVFASLRTLKADEVERLDPLVIEQARITRSYLYCEIPGFEILSPFTVAQTKSYAKEMLLQRALLSLVIPERFQANNDAPQSIFLDDHPPWNAAALYEAMDQFAVAKPGYDRDEALARLHQIQKQDLILYTGESYSLPANVILQSLEGVRGRPNRSDAPGNVSSLRVARVPSPDRVVYYLSIYGIDFAGFDRGSTSFRSAFPLPSFFEHRRPRLPEWLEEELETTPTVAGFLRNRRFYQNISGPPELRVQTPGFTLEPKVTWTVDRVFAKPTAPGVRDGKDEGRSEFIHAFMDWALLDGKKSRATAFWKFVEQATRQPVTAAIFADCFGSGGWGQLQSYAKAHNTSARFVGTGNDLDEQIFRAPNKLNFPEPTVRPATKAESVRIRSEYEWELGREFAAADPELSRQCLDQAGRRLRKAYDEGQRDPQLVTVLALYERYVEALPDARKHLEEAAAAHVVRPCVYYEQARFRYADERGKLATAEDKLNAEQTRFVLEPLEIALSQRPALNEVYHLMSEIWTHTTLVPSEKVLATLAAGVSLFPRDPELAYEVALLHLRSGAAREAETITTQGLYFAPADSKLRAQLVDLASTARKAYSVKLTFR